MIIGNFKYDADTDTYAGDVTTLTFQRSNVQLTPHEKSGDKEPDYRLVGETDFGSVEFGAAWKRTGDGGQEFLSVSIDDPTLPGSLNAVMFRDEDSENATLVWKRKKPEQKASGDTKAPKPAKASKSQKA